MSASRSVGRLLLIASLLLASRGIALAQSAPAPAAPPAAPAKPPTYDPSVGQEGKDVVWVPTPEALVQKMLDMAHLSASDYVIDLGSGDGRTVIAAAQRGATAMGIEFNPDMVALSQKKAQEAGVADRATFVEGRSLRVATSRRPPSSRCSCCPTSTCASARRFSTWRPARASSPTPSGWATGSRTSRRRSPSAPAGARRCCGSCRPRWLARGRRQWVRWCWSSSFRRSPARSAARAISGGKLTGDEIHFQVGDVQYVGKVNGTRIDGKVSGAHAAATWTATRAMSGPDDSRDRRSLRRLRLRTRRHPARRAAKASPGRGPVADRRLPQLDAGSRA